MKTWHDWVPATMGKMTMSSPPEHKFNLFIERDKNDLVTDMASVEVLFLALDKEDDAKKVLSMDLTGGWINEARNANLSVVDGLYGRCGRYPAMRDGGPTWYGLLMDTNPPSNESWWFDRFIRNPVEGWKLFRQPGGMSPRAENKSNLPPNYYENLVKMNSKRWVDIHVHGKYGFALDGEPVYDDYNDEIHQADNFFDYIPDKPLLLGLDAGGNPAAVFGQETDAGNLRIFYEIQAEPNTGPISFSEILNRLLKEKFPLATAKTILAWCDPSAEYGGDNKHAEDFSWFQKVKKETGINIRPAPGGNLLGPRLEAVAKRLRALPDGQPAIVISAKGARLLREGFMGGYRYKKNGNELSDKPEKNKFSHVHDALQYLVKGVDHGDATESASDRVKSLAQSRQTYIANHDFDVMRA